AAGQGEVHVPAFVAQHQRRADDVTFLLVAVGTLDPFDIDQARLAIGVAGFAWRAGMGLETDPGLTVTLEGLDVAGVQGRGLGAAVDLGAELGNAEPGQADPLAQANHRQMVECLHQVTPSRCRASWAKIGISTSLIHWPEVSFRQNPQEYRPDE